MATANRVSEQWLQSSATGAETDAASGAVRTVRAACRRAISSLQCKATILITILTLAVTGGVSGSLLRYSSRLVRSEQEAHLLLAASLFADAVAPALEAHDASAIAAIASRAANHSPLAFVSVVDVDRHVLTTARGATGNAAIGEEVFSVPEGLPSGVQVLASEDDGPVVLALTYPVRSRVRSSGATGDAGVALLGYVRLGMVADRWERSMASRLDLLIGVGMVATVFVIPVGFLLIRRIIAPLESLADVMTRFADGDLDVRSTIDRHDEIGRLAAAFNRMADQHQRIHAGLIRLNAELEERVASRTRQLREIASREPLTGLYNRRYFNEVLQRRFAEAQRYGAELSCVMIDLDGFKDTNDAFGHHVGDELLVLTAATILSQLRTADVAARYGGDEFVILLPQTDARRAEVLADRITQKFVRDAAARFPQLKISMSVGIASLSTLESRDPEALIRAADRAMYQAKAEGKNRIVGPDRVTQTAGRG